MGKSLRQGEKDMKIIKAFFRMYVNDLNDALPFYEELYGSKNQFRFKYDEMNLELASIGDLLLIAGSAEALRTFKKTKMTFVVDSLADFLSFFEKHKVKVISGPRQVPTGKNATVRHPDGTIAEYVEHKKPFFDR